MIIYISKIGPVDLEIKIGPVSSGGEYSKIQLMFVCFFVLITLWKIHLPLNLKKLKSSLHKDDFAKFG